MSNYLSCCPRILRFYIKHLIILIFSSSTTYSEATISCHYEVNLSLGNNCQFQLSPQHILSNGNSSGPYTLMVTTSAGAIVPNNLLDYSHISDRIIAKVTNMSGNSCWGYINVEDKTKPNISCIDYTISCNQNTVPLPTVEDACTTVDLHLISVQIDTLACDDDFLYRNTRVFQASDESGNTSTCHQTISVSRFAASSIIWPPDTTIACNTPFLTLGVPTIMTDTVVAISDIGCNLDVGYSDVVDSSSGCPLKILRTWKISETHCDTIITFTQLQTIELIDDVAPTINCPSDLTVQPSNVDCSATVELQLPVITDDCSGVSKLDISYDGKTVFNVITNPIITLSESTKIEYSSTDLCGNLSACSSNIIVTGTLSPEISCPMDITVACSDPLLDDLRNFGFASASGGCSALSTIEASPDSILNTCGLGSITRNFSATYSGSTLNCQQNIRISQTPAFNSSNVTCPADSIIVDEDVDVATLDTGSPLVDLTGLNCTDINIDHETIKTKELDCGEEFKKDWIIVDNCTNEVNFCQQVIQTRDESETTLNCPNVEVTTTECDENFLFVDLPVSLAINCNGSYTATNNSPYALDNDSPNAQGSYPIGTHNITVTINSSVGITTCNYTVTVLDGLDQITSCKKIIETILPGSGTTPPRGFVEIDQACLAFNPSCVGAEYDSSFEATDLNATSFYVYCDDLGLNPYSVYLWRDGFLVDSCTTLIQVLDGFGLCISPSTSEILGAVHTEDKQMIPNVMVDLLGHNSTGYMTNSAGQYIHTNVALNHTYEIVPTKTDDQLNGLSTMDLILIQRHILGVELLDSPYKIIAADVNKSDHISGADLVELRKLILGISSEEKSMITWRMIDAAHEFIDDQDPFISLVPETYLIQNLNNKMEVDFIGVKLGDVNSSVKMASNSTNISARRSTEISFEVDEKQYFAGNILDIPIKIPDVNNMDGFQFSLRINPTLGKLISATSSLDNFNETSYHIESDDSGSINISWIPSVQKYSSEKEQSINLRIKVLKNSETSELIKLSSDGLEPQTYTKEGTQSLTIEYVKPSKIELLQNIPNPWSSTTEIRFQLPTDSDASLKVFTSTGKLVYKKSIEGKTGTNSVTISKDDIGTEGLFFYELSHGKESIVKRMLIVSN